MNAKQHRFPGVYIVSHKANSPNDFLATKSPIPMQSSVFGEDEEIVNLQDAIFCKWNPFHCVLAASVIGGIDNIHIDANARVLCVAGNKCNATTIFHLTHIAQQVCVAHTMPLHPNSTTCYNSVQAMSTNSDMVTANSILHVMGTTATDYHQLVGQVDTIIYYASTSVQYDAQQLAEHAQQMLKPNGHFVMIMFGKELQTDAPVEVGYANMVVEVRKYKFKPLEQLTLEPFYANVATLVGRYEPRN